MNPSSSKNIAIIGAGITGLSAAYHLIKAGHSVTLLEASAHTGGVIQSTTTDGFLCENGPNSILLSDKRVADLLDDLSLSDEVVTSLPTAQKRFIVHNSKLHPLPSSPLSAITTPLFSLGAKLRLLKEPFVSKRKAQTGSECMSDFVRRRLGQEFLDKAAAPFINGIYAGDPNRLSVNHAFPRLHALEQEYGSLIKGAIQLQKLQKNGKGDPNRISPRQIISFRKGMQALPDALTKNLPEGTLYTSTTIYNINQNPDSLRWFIDWKCEGGATGQGSYDHVIITVPAHKIGDLPLAESVLDAVSKLPDIVYPPVTTVQLGFQTSQIKHPLDGFGMLVALKEKSKILGTLFSSSLFPGRAPQDHTLLTVMLGGARTPEHARMSDSALKVSIMDELRKLLHINGTPTFTHITRWEKAIPQLNLGYGKILEQIEQAERDHPRIHFLGNYRSGISVTDCILSGIDITDKIQSL